MNHNNTPGPRSVQFPWKVITRKRERHSQNGNSSKINPEKVACFSSPKNDRQLTSNRKLRSATCCRLVTFVAINVTLECFSNMK